MYTFSERKYNDDERYACSIRKEESIMLKRWASSLLIAVLVLATLGGVSALAEGTTALREAPMLDALVASGELPPVEERMPVASDILVVDVEDEIGQYGGTYNSVWQGVDNKWTPGKMTEEPLFRFKADGSGVEPNVAKGYDVSDDARVYTIYLREGMRWSDGVPFTADDVLFYWEHMLSKETFGKQIYDCYYSTDPETGDKALCTVEKIDDYTFQITHKYPSPLFLERVAIDNKWFFAPKHYQETILAEFIGEEAAQKKAEELGFNDISGMGKWTGYYYWVWPQIPTLRAWVATTDPNSDQFVMTRNPYYFKTDAEGNQLPYIDELVFTRIQDDSHRELLTLSGELSLEMFDISKYTMLKENEDKGNYRIYTYSNTEWASQALQLNQTVADENLRALFQDIRFREALSVAANREDICEIVYDGLVNPQQSSIPEGLVNYQEGWADVWVEYDPDRANELLDEIGLTWDANNEFRTFADGSELTLTMQFVSDDNKNKTAELLARDYEAVGIRTNIKLVDDALFQELKYNNELISTLETIGSVNISFRPDTVLPLRVLTPWYGWYGLYNATGGTEGVEPEGDVALLLEDWSKITSSTSPEEITQWADEIVKLHVKNNWVIGYTSPSPTVVVVTNSLKNVPEYIIDCDEFRNLGHARPFQFFFDNE